MATQLNASYQTHDYGVRPSLFSAKNLIIFGDSFTSNCENNSAGNLQALLNGSYGTWLNILSPRAVRIPFTNNFGVSGDITHRMLGRISGPLAAIPDIVVMPCGTNDVAIAADFASGVTAPVSKLKTMAQIFMDNGAIVIWPSIIPRPGTFSATQVSWALAFNQAMKRYAETTRGFIYVDLDPTMTDLTAASWTILSGYLNTDNVHPSNTGSYNYANAIATVLNGLIPSWYNHVTSGSDTYSLANNPGGNRLPNGIFATTSGGSVTGTTTGTAAGSTTVDNSLAGGAAVAASVGALTNGMNSQIVDISGPKTGNNTRVDVTQSVTGANLTDFRAGDVVEGTCYFEINSNSNITGVDLSLSITESGNTNVYNGALGQNGQVGPANAYSGYIRTPRKTLGATPTNMFLRGMVKLLDGSVTPAATVKYSQFAVRKVL